MTTRSRTAWLLLLPAALLILAFLVVPIVGILARSVTEPELGLGTYRELLADDATTRILARTFLMAVGAVLICLAMGYPYAYLMTLVGPTWRVVLMVLVLVPFWTSLMARTFAWISLLQRDGPVASLLGFFGAQDVTLLNSATGVMIGMVQILLPYMVLTLATSLRAIDRGLLTAAQSLGANRFRAFWQVYLPLSVPGILAGSALVFILAIGFYITPQLLGSPRESLMAQVIGVRVEKLVDFAGAGGLSAILLLATLALVLVGAFVLRPLQRRLGVVEGEGR
jgi:putative spermidine/putrescine transport system permease protein